MKIINRVAAVAATFVAASSAIAGAAHAEEWIVTVGGRGTVAPPYEGADRVVLRGAPSVNLRKASTPYRYTPPDGGFRIGVLSSRYITAGPIFRLQEERNHKGKLEGLAKVDWAVEAGGFVDLWPTSWLRAHVEARKGISGHHGYVGEAGLDLVSNRENWNMSVGPRVGLGDNIYMRQYFGVTPFQAANSPYITQAFQPDAGPRYAGVAASVSHRMGDHWRATVDASYHRLVGDAYDSPVVRVAGDTNQFSGGVGLYYSFGVGH